MLKTVTWVEDGMLLSSLPPNIAAAAVDREWIDSGSSEPRLNFCGYACLNDAAFFSLPKTTFAKAHSPAERIVYARIVFHAVAKFAKLSKSPSVAGEQVDETDQSSMTRILLYQTLIEDWSRHGIYKHTQYQDRISSRGRTIWPKTIAKVTPYIDANNSPIYLQNVTRLRQNNFDNLISDVHAWAVAKADRSIGWLYSSNEKTILFDELTGKPDLLQVDAAFAVTTLRKRLNQTFDYRTIWLLKTLIRIIEFENEFSGNTQVFGLRYFWRMWEHMCRAWYTTTAAHSALICKMPRPFYHYGVSVEPKAFSHQIPDILVQPSADVMWIRDAKYYDITFTTPSWGDVVKQIFYAETIRQAGIAQSTNSIFIFPEPVTQARPQEIKVHDTQGAHLSSIETIKCEYLDLIEVCQGYLSASVD